jgi:hypothetical protein
MSIRIIELVNFIELVIVIKLDIQQTNPHKADS